MRYETSIDALASVAATWQAVTDVVSWPQWTASMKSIELLDNDPLHVGSRARVRQPKLPTVIWQVSSLRDQEEFTWETRSPGVRTAARHALSRNADGSMRITLEIDQTGPLAPVVAALTGGRTRKYMQLEAAGLKAASEAVSGR